MSAPFVPIWNNNDGNLFTAVEGVSVERQLSVIETYAVTVSAGTFQITVGPSAANVISITTPTQQIGYHVDPSGREVVFQPLPTALLLTLTRKTQATITLLNGALPPGLSLSPSGLISGIPTGGAPSLKTFDFVIRAANEFMVRDRAFSITITGTATPAAFDSATLPPTVVEPYSQISASNIGSYQLGESIWYSIDVIQSEFIIPPVSIVPIVQLNETLTLIDGLPSGIEMTKDLQIKGTVAPDATPGTYLFEIQINDPIQATTNIFMLSVVDTRVTSIDIPLVIDWATGSDLGTIPALLPCALSTTAKSNRSPIVYSLSPYSNPLPLGLVLDASSGALTGSPLEVSGDQVTFVARATIGYAFVEQNFTIEVLSSPLSVNAGRAYLLVDVPQTTIEIANVANAIPSAMVFQPNNPDFGISSQPIIDVIGGLGGETFDLTALTVKDTNAIANGDYYYSLSLITGSLALSTVSDSFGNALYDVIYRTLHDPNVDAGGYVINGSSMVESAPVMYGLNGVRQSVYINSVENIRCDLVSKMGFDSSADVAHLMGSTGPELVPLWMGATYQLGFPLVYVQPGYGATALRLLGSTTGIAPLGNTLYFNKIFIERDSSTQIVPLQ